MHYPLSSDLLSSCLKFGRESFNLFSARRVFKDSSHFGGLLWVPEQLRRSVRRSGKFVCKLYAKIVYEKSYKKHVSKSEVPNPNLAKIGLSKLNESLSESFSDSLRCPSLRKHIAALHLKVL